MCCSLEKGMKNNKSDTLLWKQNHSRLLKKDNKGDGLTTQMSSQLDPTLIHQLSISVYTVRLKVRLRQEGAKQQFQNEY